MTNKFIFLDIDGPMKPGRCYFAQSNHDGGFDPLAIAAVNRICEKTGAEIVFNTTWNLDNIIEIAKEQGIVAKIAGKTKYPHLPNRLTAIKHWLEDNNQLEAAWIALDDCKIDHPNAILVCPENGISCNDYREACIKLGNPDAFMVLI